MNDPDEYLYYSFHRLDVTSDTVRCNMQPGSIFSFQISQNSLQYAVLQQIHSFDIYFMMFTYFLGILLYRSYFSALKNRNQSKISFLKKLFYSKIYKFFQLILSYIHINIDLLIINISFLQVLPA
ncbi:hypothetical protein EDEG_03979 [Edhazardia aedis USNM 41457]|uniref:Transmembrane protein n=1 Tax=Edhazardia aedis (strain USNM 41457) TaxID=1003232 RepID=J9D1E0_EDHAE|nr:hypothetical protein EDEG_03979 [Edhazardia aedis USNM 41457]|eukprot:EJW01394.1 hypothetical protein EDEG_03979 [Edhazardia aedis USNM 41457]